jgi:hypothetical protein
VFNFFKSKKPKFEPNGLNLLEVKNDVFKFFETKHPEQIEEAKAEFVNLTGQFDEEHEYFESKLDDFRNWFLFFYGHKQFLKLERAKLYPEVAKNYEYLTSGIFSIFIVQRIKKDMIFLKDMFSNKDYIVKDDVASLSIQKSDLVQTSVYQKEKDVYEFGLSIICHPSESYNFVKNEIKAVKKITTENSKSRAKEELFETLMTMRYQFFKYKQVEISKIYSDRPLFDKKS